MKRGGIVDNFDQEDFHKCINERGSNYWEPYNQTIYKMFKNDTVHKDVNWTFTKVAGLDKLYSINLDQYLFTARKKKKTDWLVNKSGVHMALVQKLVVDGRRRKRFIKLLPPSKTSQSRLVISDLKGISSNVIKLAAFIKELCGWKDDEGGDGPISFAAKYLHFHSGIVPVFDRRASTVLYNLETGKNVKNKTLGYELFCEFFADALTSGYYGKKKFTPAEIKNLDGYLYYQSRGDWP